MRIYYPYVNTFLERIAKYKDNADNKQGEYPV